MAIKVALALFSSATSDGIDKSDVNTTQVSERLRELCNQSLRYMNFYFWFILFSFIILVYFGHCDKRINGQWRPRRSGCHGKTSIRGKTYFKCAGPAVLKGARGATVLQVFVSYWSKTFPFKRSRINTAPISNPPSVLVGQCLLHRLAYWQLILLKKLAC